MSQNNSEQSADSQKGVYATLTRHGGLSYLEIPAIDVGRSAAFYANVLRWVMRGEEGAEAQFADPSGHLIGKWMTGRVVSRRPGWLPFIYVDEIAEVVGRVVANGGEIVKAPYSEGNLLVAVIRDPAGNMLGVWEEAGG